LKSCSKRNYYVRREADIDKVVKHFENCCLENRWLERDVHGQLNTVVNSKKNNCYIPVYSPFIEMSYDAVLPESSVLFLDVALILLFLFFFSSVFFAS